MKNLLGLLLLMTMSFSVYGQKAVAEYTEDSHDFGTITEGTQAKHVFTVKNTGNADLMIVNVRPSCGCTTPSWTREPIAPGKTGTITAVFNSSGRPGNFHKSITVTTNEPQSNNTKVIFIKGTVTGKGSAKPAEETPVRVPGS
ncbi:MAG: DUF1573 domain-containing protein [Bacteroidia bacterium]